MWRKNELCALLALAASLALTGCSSSDDDPGDPAATKLPPAAIPVRGPSVPPTPVKLIAADRARDAGTTDASGH